MSNMNDTPTFLPTTDYVLDNDIKFYDYKNKKVVYLKWKDISKNGIPVGNILYRLIENKCYLYNGAGIQYDTEGIV